MSQFIVSSHCILFLYEMILHLCTNIVGSSYRECLSGNITLYIDVKACISTVVWQYILCYATFWEIH